MGRITATILEGLSPNQQQAAEKRDCDILVRAGAGSGKTKTLVARYLLLLDGNRSWKPADITAVTFTRKAAREMQSRIRSEMTKLAWLPENGPEERKFWLERLNEMDSANIGTIHSLCGRILRAHPAEAGLDPAFSVLDDNSAALLNSQIVEETISRISVNPHYEALLNFYSGDRLTRILTEMLKNREKMDRLFSVNATETGVYLKKKAAEALNSPRYSVIIEEYREMTAAPGFDKNAGALAERIRGLIAAYDQALSLLDTESHPMDTLSCVYSAFNGWSFNQGNKQLRANAQLFRDELEREFLFLKKDSKNPNRNITWYRQYWEQYDAAESCLRRLWPELRIAYMKALDSAQMIDFDAMESLTLDLLRNHEKIREAWISQVKSLLVDEFQDTNDAQTELFSLLDPAHDRLFAVGDKKQSIYGFRGTNVSLFDRRGGEVSRFGGENIRLDITYRTAPELLEPMGCLLEHVMADTALSEKDYYAPYEAMRSPGNDQRKTPLLKSGPFIGILLGNIQNKEDDPGGEIIGRMLAQRLSELMENGSLQTWSDAAILCRTSNDFKQFEDGLEAWHIPYVTVAGKGYYDRPEIRDILNILRSAENPDDNAVFTGFLMSPSIGFTAEMTAVLFRFANRGGLKMSFRQAFFHKDFCFGDTGKQQILERARTIMTELIRITGQVPLDEVLEEAYRLTGIRTMLALDSGDRAWLNLDKLIPAARESGLTSVSEFLEYLEQIKETGAREGEAPSDDNGAVRIMTIHQAKGLEFPLTIVADDVFKSHSPLFAADNEGSAVFISSPANPRYADAKNQADERDKAEWLRLFYVAATRAESGLILCGKMPSFDGKSDSWLKRSLEKFPDEWFEDGVHTGPAWGMEGETVRVWCASELPEIPEEPKKESGRRRTVVEDCSLLQPLPDREMKPRSPEHTAALTIGKLVHKGIELWRFPENGRSDPVLEDAFSRVLMQTDRLDAEEKNRVIEKANMLLARFRKSEAFERINSASQRWHELPFSYIAGSNPVNGVFDLLIRDGSGYTVIDFKTDALDSLKSLSDAEENYAGQLRNYRRAVNIILGEDPKAMFCFLDYCGKVLLHTPGRDALPLPEEEPEPDEWLPEEDAEDEYWDVTVSGFSDLPETDF